jgi:hypothetical protein
MRAIPEERGSAKRGGYVAKSKNAGRVGAISVSDNNVLLSHTKHIETAVKTLQKSAIPDHSKKQGKEYKRYDGRRVPSSPHPTLGAIIPNMASLCTCAPDVPDAIH